MRSAATRCRSLVEKFCSVVPEGRATSTKALAAMHCATSEEGRRAHTPATRALELRHAQRALAACDHDAVAIGSPHLSLEEIDVLRTLLAGRKTAVPLYACTGRHVLTLLERDGQRTDLERCGVVIVADTCVVVTPILPERPGAVLMTNSGKFAHYAPSNTGYGVLYASLADCVESAVAGRPVIAEYVA